MIVEKAKLLYNSTITSTKEYHSTLVVLGTTAYMYLFALGFVSCVFVQVRDSQSMGRRAKMMRRAWREGILPFPTAPSRQPFSSHVRPTIGSLFFLRLVSWRITTGFVLSTSLRRIVPLKQRTRPTACLFLLGCDADFPSLMSSAELTLNAVTLTFDL